jgi:hypothetical protein
MSIGLAYAGAVLTPPGTTSLRPPATGKHAPLQAQLQSQQSAWNDTPLPELGEGQILAGSAKISLRPRPEDYAAQFPGARWEQNRAECATLEPSQDAVEGTATHVADFRVRWAENPNCLYMGGYGIGPMNPITSWDDDYGLWVRSVAMSDGVDTMVLTLIDAIYWEAHYNNLCPGDPCGFLDLAKQLSAETGLPESSFVFASTHSHTSMDFIGGWGAVPDWYMQQATDSLKQAVRLSVADLQPAILEAGESIARGFSGERRDFYRSAEDNAMSWLRLIDADDQPKPETCTTPAPAPSASTGNNGSGGGNGFGNQGKATPAPAPTPVCEPAAPGRAIATIGAYAAHPVTEDEGGGQADADFPAVFAKTVEDKFGGTGMFLQTGLGNISPRGDKLTMGTGLANVIPAIGGGQVISNTDLRIARRAWDQPVTNSALGALGVTGFFDRTMNQAPASIDVGKGGEENKRCHSASPISVNTSVTAAKIGPLWITGGPGELFSNITNSIEERNPNGITMALGLVNDGLGYLVQSFETDHAGRQALGFAGKAGPVGLAEYEDAYSIDHCFGDAALEYTIQLLGSL